MLLVHNYGSLAANLHPDPRTQTAMQMETVLVVVLNAVSWGRMFELAPCGGRADRPGRERGRGASARGGMLLTRISNPLLVTT